MLFSLGRVFYKVDNIDRRATFRLFCILKKDWLFFRQPYQERKL